MTKDEALKLALEALRLCTNVGMIPMYLQANQTAITAIKEALAQPEQKTEMVGRITDNIKDMVLRQEVMLYTDKYLPIGTPVYTTPPQRKPLTDEEIMNIAKVSCIGISPQEDTLNFAKVIEAVHGIKGEA